jgi:5-methylcytosine-specific restriction enzyme subunit McrC
MRRHLQLTEYKTSASIPLSHEERDALRELVPSLTIEPSVGTEDRYDITPGSTIGAVQLDGFSIEIQPKIPIDRVVFLISYALDPKQWLDSGFDFATADSLVDAIVPGFARQLRRALQRGLLQGYRSQEDSLATVRGQIRFGDQIRQRQGLMLPLEVTFDEFTEDIVENQVLKAAIHRLSYRRIRSEPVRRMLREFDALLASVELVPFNPRNLPEVQFTRLNEHYQPAIALAKLILRSTSWELRQGRVQASAFLVDMNRVFEEFVIIALREELHVNVREFPANARGRSLFLDQAKCVRLEPDVSWWHGNQCLFVGDVKYKRIDVKGYKHPDLYQLLAYTTATNLTSGMLIYAAGESDPRTHEVPMAGKLLEVVSLDLSGTPEDILSQMRKLAHRIRQEARETKTLSY